jgi:hypothetical protein
MIAHWGTTIAEKKSKKRKTESPSGDIQSMRRCDVKDASAAVGAFRGSAGECFVARAARPSTTLEPRARSSKYAN